MEITGRIIKKMQPAEGVSKAGKPWKKQDFVIETQEQYPRKVCISVMNDKVDDLAKYNEGDLITAGINIEPREYNGRYYTEVRAWTIKA